MCALVRFWMISTSCSTMHPNDYCAGSLSADIHSKTLIQLFPRQRAAMENRICLSFLVPGGVSHPSLYAETQRSDINQDDRASSSTGSSCHCDITQTFAMDLHSSMLPPIHCNCPISVDGEIPKHSITYTHFPLTPADASSGSSRGSWQLAIFAAAVRVPQMHWSPISLPTTLQPKSATQVPMRWISARWERILRCFDFFPPAGRASRTLAAKSRPSVISAQLRFRSARALVHEVQYITVTNQPR